MYNLSFILSPSQIGAPPGDIIAFATQKEIDRQNNTNLVIALNNLFPGNKFEKLKQHAAYALVGKKGITLPKLNSISIICTTKMIG